MTRAQELERDIRLHERTLSDPSNIKSEYHRINVENSLLNARAELKELNK